MQVEAVAGGIIQVARPGTVVLAVVVAAAAIIMLEQVEQD
jgi:hypothetical protein